MGTILPKMFNKCELLLRDVRYVPELKRNLISKSMYYSLCYCTIIEHGMLKIYYGALITAKSSKISSLYILD